jgi:hypothetical protein
MHSLGPNLGYNVENTLEHETAFHGLPVGKMLTIHEKLLQLKTYVYALHYIYNFTSFSLLQIFSARRFSHPSLLFPFRMGVSYRAGMEHALYPLLALILDRLRDIPFINQNSHSKIHSYCVKVIQLSQQLIMARPGMSPMRPKWPRIMPIKPMSRMKPSWPSQQWAEFFLACCDRSAPSSYEV